MDSAKRIMNGTFGEVWFDGEYLAEVYKCQAKYSYTKQSVIMPGQMAEDTKTTSIKGTGSLGMHKANSRMILKVADAIQSGKDVRFTVISKLDDPDALGSERVALYNVSLDDLTLIDWERGVNGKIESPFTFTKHKLLDTVEAR